MMNGGCGCGGCDEDKPKVPTTSPSRYGDLPRAVSGPRRVPISSQSGLVAPISPLAKPGFTAYKAPFDIKGIGSRELGPTGKAPRAGTQSDGKGITPYPVESGLGRPGQIPTTTQPLSLATIDRATYFVHRHPLVPRPPLMRPLPSSYGDPRILEQMKLDYNGKYRWVEFDRQVRAARIAAKRPVFLTGGPSALQYAQAPRVNPTTPSLIRGTGPQELLRPTTLRGDLNISRYAPRPIVDRMAHEALIAERNPR